MTSLPPVANISGKKILDALFFRKVPLKAWPPQLLEASYAPVEKSCCQNSKVASFVATLLLINNTK
jgi:hypothetical protein